MKELYKFIVGVVLLVLLTVVSYLIINYVTNNSENEVLVEDLSHNSKDIERVEVPTNLNVEAGLRSASTNYDELVTNISEEPKNSSDTDLTVEQYDEYSTYVLNEFTELIDKILDEDVMHYSVDIQNFSNLRSQFLSDVEDRVPDSRSELHGLIVYATKLHIESMSLYVNDSSDNSIISKIDEGNDSLSESIKILD